MNDSTSNVPGGHLPSGTLPAPPDSHSNPIGEYLFGCVSVALGIYILIAANFVRVPASSNTLGPKAFPFLVGAVLVVTGIVVLVEVWRGKLGQAEESEDIDSAVKTDWLTVAKMIAFFFAHCYLIGLVGWPVAAAVLFAGSAWSLGAKRWWLASAVGLALALVVQFLFGTMLGLSLPPGPLFDWIPFL